MKYKVKKKEKRKAERMGERKCEKGKMRRNKSLPHHKVIGTRAMLALKWLVWG